MTHRATTTEPGCWWIAYGPVGSAKRRRGSTSGARRWHRPPSCAPWYRHDPDRFEQFRRRYLAELDDPMRAEGLAQMRDLVGHGPVTLLTATNTADISEAAVLADLLDPDRST